MAYDVYGVGNALVDIQARITDQVLEQIGFPKGAMTLVGELDQVRLLSELDGGDVTRCAGGSAANTIMGVVDLGGSAAYAGKTGRDEIGDFFLNDMRERGVKIEVPQTDGHSGTSVILITEDAERTMLTHLGLSATLDENDIDEEEIKRSKYVYLEGYLFTNVVTRKAAYRAIELAKANGIKVALTASDPFVVGMKRDEFWELIEGPVDLLFCNLEEARSLAEKEDPIDCAQEIHSHAENVALTLGGDGSILMHEGQAIPIEGTSVDPIDTTGAGDMYAAGILYGVTNGMSWRDAGRLASYAAGRIVSQMGARFPGRLSAEDVERFRS